MMLPDLSEFCLFQRQQQGLTQREVSERSGVPESTLGGFERGRFIPNIYTIECIVDSLGYELRIEKKGG